MSLRSAVVVWLLAAAAPAIQAQAIGPFSEMPVGAAPNDWFAQELKDVPPSEFRVVSHVGETVLQVAANRSASGLVHPVSAELSSAGQLSWRWKVGLHPPTDIRSRDGDDYAARVYVTFDRDPGQLSWLTRLKLRFAKMLYGVELPAASICYVWDPNSPEGFAIPNAWSDTIYMVVAEGGPGVNEWVNESHNVLDDYRRLFKAEPPPITGVIVAADTDNTGTASIAWFGDVVLSQ